MKNMRLLTLGAALTCTSLMPLATTAPTAPPGPGGVIEAVKAFSKAIATGDVAYLRSAMADHEAYKGAPGFHDLAFDGKPVEADTLADFADAWQASVDRRGPIGVKHDIKRIVADCPSGTCSYAYVEFDRLIGAGKKQRVPMRATVLLTHTDAKPWFKIFHWNVSRADGEAWATVPQAKTAK